MLTSQTPRGLLLSFSAIFLLLVQAQPAAAQAVSAAEQEDAGGVSAGASNNDSGPIGIIPATQGFNASLGLAWQHDSTNGWSSVLTPNLAYRFNRFFSGDVSVPLYGYINIDGNVGTKAKPVYQYAPRSGAFGDTSLSAHFDTSTSLMDYDATVSMGLPTGNTNFGLGAGQVTYTINNHMEKGLGIFIPDIELGIGDTSSLVDQRVVKSYVAVGPMAHFQAGVAVNLPFDCNFEADAYEQLPLSKDLIYSTTGKGKKAVTTSTNVGPAEDNGFLTTLDIPIAPHVTLSGFYSRSLRDHEDVGGFSFTFQLKTPPQPPVKIVE